MKSIIEKMIQHVFKLVGLFHSERIIYFESFHGTQYSDNPKAIYEWMATHCPDYKLVWGVNKGSEEPFRKEKVSYVLRFSWQWFLTMPRAKTWVINTRTPLWLHKNKRTTYLQTWHGTPLKQIGRDIETISIPGYTKESYDNSFSLESARWDYLISPNAYSTDIFKRAFDYKGAIIESGYPRNDVLVKQSVSNTKALKKKLNLPTDKKLVLYAPTWREKEKQVNGKYAFTVDFPFEEVVAELKESAYLLVRMHYLVAQSFDFEQYDGKVINVSTDYDMAELLAISDLLITDYSSCMFDFAITDQPIIYYIPDKEAYNEDMRGFYFPMADKMPGELASEKERLMMLLQRWQQQPEAVKTTHYLEFKEKFTSLESGTAAKQAACNVLKNCEE